MYPNKNSVSLNDLYYVSSSTRRMLLSLEIHISSFAQNVKERLAKPSIVEKKTSQRGIRDFRWIGLKL